MSLPLWYLLIPFAAVALVAGLFLLFNLFDMGKYGVESPTTRAIIYLYIGGFLGIMFLSGMNLASLNWSTELELNSLLPGTNSNVNTFGL